MKIFNLKKLATWMLAAILTCGFVWTLSSCSTADNSSAPEEQPSTDQVVLMYYTVGGGDLDDDTEEDLGKFAVEQVKGNNNVRGFVQFKYSSKHHSSFSSSYKPSGEYGGVYRFEMNKNTLNPDFDGEISEAVAFVGDGVTKLGGSDFKMYDPDNLVQFINWCMEQAPNAKAYVLAFGNHGGAYNITRDYNKSLTRGVMYDDNLPGGPCMTPTEISTALGKLTRKPDMIFFDCCLMSNLEVLGELQGKTNFVFASGHTVRQSPLDELYKALAGIAQSDNVSEGIKKYMSKYVTTVTHDMSNNAQNLSGGRIKRSGDYTLTDMSKIPDLFASIKNVVDFLAKTDISGIDVDLFDDAASGCYHYVDNRPLYDVMDYLYQLKEKVFKDNAEFATLVSQVATAVKACHVAHDEYSYDKNGTNMEYGLSYSVTLGFSSSRLIFQDQMKQYAPAESQGVIMYYIKAGKGTSEKPYYNEFLLENGTSLLATWIEGSQEMNYRTVNSYHAKGSGKHFSWENTYRTLQFDKAAGWSQWMRKNPGMPFDNPPYDEEYTYVYEDPDYYDLIEE